MFRPALRYAAFRAPRINIVNAQRFYSSSLSRPEVEKRVLDVFKRTVVDPAKITPTAKFSTDLGLDSLDTIEVMVEVEEEFGIEIPDKEADEITSVDNAIDYILAQPEAR